MQATCSECGTENPPGQMKCIKCGADLSVQAAEGEVAKPAAAPSPVNPNVPTVPGAPKIPGK